MECFLLRNVDFSHSTPDSLEHPPLHTLDGFLVPTVLLGHLKGVRLLGNINYLAF